MINLNSRNVLFLSLLIMCGCQTTRKFKITQVQNKPLHVVEIDTNRIIHECYFMNAEKENNWRHQYILNLLNENNEVIPVYNPTTKVHLNV